MKGLTTIAALPTAGGCQSALRPEDRGVERKPFATGGYVMRGSSHRVGEPPTLTLSFRGPPQDFDIGKFKRDWARAIAKGGLS